MPEYLDDPSVLTKDKLKSELVAHNVELPLGNPTKDVYVHLYLKNLTAQNNRHMTATTLDAFSSDEDLPPPVVSSRSRSSGRKATRKTDKVRPDELDVTVLSDQGLKAELLKHGVEAGPIVATTRSLYEKKLQKLLDEGPAQTQLLVPEIQINHNGNHYSDQEDEVPAAPEPEAVSEPEAVPIVERPLRSRGKTPVPPHTPNHTLTEGELELSKDSSHKPVAPLNPALLEVEKIAASDQTPKVKNDVLKDIFTNEMNSPTGISATCRRPIRGAAGRPLKASDLWKDEKFLFSPRSNSSSSSVYTESHRVSSLPPVSPRPSLPPVAPHRSMPLWVKLLLLLVLAAFLFLVYQAMETNSISPFVEQGSVVASSTA